MSFYRHRGVTRVTSRPTGLTRPCQLTDRDDGRQVEVRVPSRVLGKGNLSLVRSLWKRRTVTSVVIRSHYTRVFHHRRMGTSRRTGGTQGTSGGWCYETKETQVRERGTSRPDTERTTVDIYLRTEGRVRVSGPQTLYVWGYRGRLPVDGSRVLRPSTPTGKSTDYFLR